ncbi:MFS transporter [Paenibacillus wenxiniae]|uniref:MFS transporter n=1 Tax=Paenibacillus wenxiniae TaxID=1636843 RepID=A0ABW4RRF0_9BACL
MNIFSILSAFRGITIGLFSPIWILYLNEQGFDLLAIGILGAIFEIARLVFEIPSGTLADKMGVKRTILYSYICSIAVWLFFPFIHMVWVSVLLMLVWALADSLLSGTFETWISQSVPEKHFSKKLMKNSQILIVALILSSIISGHLYKYSPFLPFILVAGIYAIMFFIVLLYSNKGITISQNKEKDHTQEPAIQIIKNSFAIIFSTRRIFSIIIAGFFAALCYDVIMRYWQPYLIQIGASKEFLGYAMAVAGILAFLFLHLTIKLNKFIERKTILSLIVVEILSIAFIFSTAIGLKSLGLIAITFLLAVDDIRSPIINGYLNKFFPSSYKATLFSINSFFGAAGEILSGILFGLIAIKFGILNSFIVAGILLIPSIFLYYNASKNKKIELERDDLITEEKDAI